MGEGHFLWEFREKQMVIRLTALHTYEKHSLPKNKTV